MSDGKRIGKVQAAIIKWVSDSGYTYIGAGTVAHQSYGLGGRTLEEVQRSVDSLVKRGLIKQHKPGFYSLSDWKRTEAFLNTNITEGKDHE